MCVLCTLIARSSSEGGQWWPSPMREAQWSNPQDSPTLSPHGGWLVLLCAHDIAYLHPQSLPFAWVSHKKDMYICVFFSYLLLILTSHLVLVSVLLFGSCQLILFVGSTNSIQIVSSGHNSRGGMMQYIPTLTVLGPESSLCGLQCTSQQQYICWQKGCRLY